ncbi:multidrug MFS transporter [Pseudaestuariivita atlantica]|uniref:Multidrug MFS transporter n=2 Tax=Pseudaestuariivita atlantica TaxID=1317121 RepID=A0A0L1JNZ3_9RHOB|nr:multidrug MFS transporter [Pseudaestuariivita atlantica]
MSRIEFIALMGMTFATIAFSTDAMLPALPEIAAEIGPDRAHMAPLIVLTFFVGTGVGTLFTGPMSDAWGRKPVILWSGVLYVLASLIAWRAQSLEVMLAARFAQGMAAAGPRVVAIAVVRDLYAGRGMAKILSFCMIVFTLFPAVAPLIGTAIIWAVDWRAIFLAFVLFSAITTIWTMVRLPETLNPAHRRPMRVTLLWAAGLEMWRNQTVRISIMVQCFCFATIFATVATIQLIFDQSFGRADSFAVWFFAIAVVAGSGSFLNALLVERLGMQRLVKTMLGVQIFISGGVLVMLAAGMTGPVFFALSIVWLTSLFFQAALTIGNVNAIAMEPLGHIAGVATSVMASIATVVSSLMAAPVALFFDGTPLTLALGVLIFAVAGLWLMRRLAPESG